MQDLELKNRPFSAPPASLIMKSIGDHTYPQPLDIRAIQNDNFRDSFEELESTLQRIEEQLNDNRLRHSCGATATEDACPVCEEIWRAYHKFYVGGGPGAHAGSTVRWDTRLPKYRDEMTQLFDEMPESKSAMRSKLADIKARCLLELKVHFRNDMCTPHPRDTIEIAAIKAEVAQELEIAAPTAETYLTALVRLSSAKSDAVVDLQIAINNSRSLEERGEVYKKYYCTPAPKDTARQLDMKKKYGQAFSKGVQYGVVLSNWRTEVIELRQQETKKLKGKLEELKMAQSALFKNQATKKAEKDKRKRDREKQIDPIKNLVACSMPSCIREVDLNAQDGVLECMICDWMANIQLEEGEISGKRDHAYYCSEEHVEQDFAEHDHTYHACTMGENCLYRPENGPEETGLGGICSDCLEDNCITYFCSAECHERNYDLHCLRSHDQRPARPVSESLDLFRQRPLDGLEIVTLNSNKSS